MLNDKDVVALIAATLLQPIVGDVLVHMVDESQRTGTDLVERAMNDVVEIAYLLHTKSAERVVRGETPAPTA